MSFIPFTQLFEGREHELRGALRLISIGHKHSEIQHLPYQAGADTLPDPAIRPNRHVPTETHPTLCFEAVHGGLHRDRTLAASRISGGPVHRPRLLEFDCEDPGNRPVRRIVHRRRHAAPWRADADRRSLVDDIRHGRRDPASRIRGNGIHELRAAVLVRASRVTSRGTVHCFNSTCRRSDSTRPSSTSSPRGSAARSTCSRVSIRPVDGHRAKWPPRSVWRPAARLSWGRRARWRMPWNAG